MSRKEKLRLWETWVHTRIYADRGTSIAPRYQVIHQFVQRGILPFLRSKGYVLNEDASKISIRLLRYLFALYLGQRVHFKNPHQSVNAEHLDEFEHRLDFLELEPFWERWSCIEDFQQGNFGERLQYTLPYFLWANLDFSSSPAYLQLEALRRELEEVEKAPGERKEIKGKDDPYLHDSSRPSYEDRHWH